MTTTRLARALLLTVFLAASPAAGQTPGPGHPSAVIPRGAGTWEASGHDGAVVAGGAGAVGAGIEVLKAGGNAADGAAATILALTVTDGTSVCFGGEVPILYYDAATRTVEVIAGLGVAPALATPEFFAARGGIPDVGLLPAAVPALLDACLVLLDRHGSVSFTTASAPMLALLDKHEKPWHADLARTVRRLATAEAAAGADRRRGLRLVADSFYRGPIAHELDAWSRAHGGLIRYGDLARHVTRVEEPVAVTYRGYSVVKCGPWTQGPALLEALQLLAGYDLKALGPDSPDAAHLTVEALKLALADRDVYYADPLFEDVPLTGLLSPTYASARRSLIDPARASLVPRPGDPRAGKALRAGAPPTTSTSGPARDTTTCLVADRAGNVVAATPSGWSGVVAGDTGVWLGTRLQSFTLQAGHPNRLAPGKRPRITLTPTLVLRDDKPVLAVSVAGGDNQDQMTLQLLIDTLDFGLSPAVAVTAPRFMSDHFIGSFLQTPPKLGSLRVNASYGQPFLDALTARGHLLKVSDTILGAAPTLIAIDPSTHLYRAAGDPRGDTRGHIEGRASVGLSESAEWDNIEFDTFTTRISGGVMDLSRDIHPLTDFKRNTPEFLRQLKETGHPLVLTINGKAELVVQDARSYQRLLAVAERLETIQAVREGLDSMKRGEGRGSAEVFAAIEEELQAQARR